MVKFAAAAARRNTPQLVAAQPDFPLVLGRAPWWQPHSSQPLRGQIVKQQKVSFTEALKDFLHNVSFHCYGKLVEPGRRFQERFFWIIFHITTLSILIVFLWNTHIYNERLLTTTMFDPLYPIRKAPFPAVSICTVNRISNVSATDYAYELHTKDPLQRGVRYFYDQIIKLRYNYNYYIQDDNTDFEEALEFQSFLDIHDTEDSELFYNTRRRMHMLTPNCSDMLVRCRLANKDVNCLDEFQVTLTGNGFCCTFNSDGKYAKTRPNEMSLFSEQKGLVTLLRAPTRDTYYKISRLEGFVLYLYSFRNYADVGSGLVNERFVQTNSEIFLSIQPRILQTVSEARLLPPTLRKCYFADEMPRAFGKEYSFNKCITRCRVHSILVLCNCLLFMHPNEYLDVATDTVYCTLRHIECLTRYDFKWANVITKRGNVPGLETEMEDALYCPQCLPLCTETRYQTKMLGLPLNSYKIRTFFTDFDGNTSDLAVVRIYFGEPNVQYFRQILKENWFELFSFIGNICSIITGFSLVGICEVFYFFMRQLYVACTSEVDSDRGRNAQQPNAPLLIFP